MSRKFLKKYLPNIVKKNILMQYRNVVMLKAYIYDFKKYSKYSRTKYTENRIMLEGVIIKKYHVVEKGLTMPNRRLNFGKDNIISLCEDCIKYITKYGEITPQIKHAIGVIREYQSIHRNVVIDLSVSLAIERLLSMKEVSNISKTEQKSVVLEEYFKDTESSFPIFSNSRRSIRSFTNETISIEKLKRALVLSLNTPSACNRQPFKTYVYTDKNQIQEILQIQGGNRGFGHLVDKLIIITSELGVFEATAERHQAYIDGGIYTMNLLYALHYEQIACCVLNCCNTPKKEKMLQEICKTRESEVYIAMIACGILPKEILIASSPRRNLEEIATIQ